MKLKSVIETDFTTVNVDSTLGDLVKVVSKSKLFSAYRNLLLEISGE